MSIEVRLALARSHLSRNKKLLAKVEEGLLDKIEDVDLSKMNIKSEHAIFFFHWINSSQRLKSLNLSNNNLQSTGLTYIIAALYTNTSLTDLDIKYIFFAS